MQNEQEIRRLMNSGMDVDETQSRTRSAVSRVRRQVGQRDTLSFALVRIWAALARLLAPFFARFGEHQAEAVYRHAQAAESGREQNGADSSDNNKIG